MWPGSSATTDVGGTVTDAGGGTTFDANSTNNLNRTQAIAIAGGFVDFAKNKQVLLFRRYSDDTVEVKILNLKDVLKNKDPREDVMLQPGDMLYVPKTWMAAIDRFLPRTSLGTYFSPALL